MLSRRLNMDEDSAEKWIVNLIRRAQLDAKIDSKDRQIFMHPSHPSVYVSFLFFSSSSLDISQFMLYFFFFYRYQQVFQRTSDLCFRTMVLFNNIEKRKDISQPRRNQPRKKWLDFLFHLFLFSKICALLTISNTVHLCIGTLFIDFTSFFFFYYNVNVTWYL